MWENDILAAFYSCLFQCSVLIESFWSMEVLPFVVRNRPSPVVIFFFFSNICVQMYIQTLVSSIFESTIPVGRIV